MDVGVNEPINTMKGKVEREVKMKERQNVYLIYELYKEMEVELNKGALHMNTWKIKYIVLLLEQLEERGKFLPKMNVEKFFKKFNKKYGIELSSEKAMTEKIKKNLF